MKKLPLIIAHRGASEYVADNSLDAFLLAEKQGADIVEMDVRVTKDQVLILRHSDTIQIDEHKLKIKNHTLEEIESHGVKCTKLEEVIETLPKHIRLDLDLKDEVLDIPLAKLIESHNLKDRIILDSSNAAVLTRLSQFFPDVPLALSSSTTKDPFHISQTIFGTALLFFGPIFLQYPVRAIFMRRIKKILPTYVCVFSRICKRSDVDVFHSLGIKVFVYTVNKEKNMRKFIDMGVDGIKTDKPDLLFSVLKQ